MSLRLLEGKVRKYDVSSVCSVCLRFSRIKHLLIVHGLSGTSCKNMVFTIAVVLYRLNIFVRLQN